MNADPCGSGSTALLLLYAFNAGTHDIQRVYAIDEYLS